MYRLLNFDIPSAYYNEEMPASQPVSQNFNPALWLVCMLQVQAFRV